MSDNFPRFGVPDRIEARDIAFIVTAGIGLDVLLAGVTGMTVPGLFATFPALTVPMIAAGPASAYYLAQWLRARRIPLVLGCGGLVLWSIGVLLAALIGWLGLGVAAVLTALWMRRANRRSSAARSPQPTRRR